MLRNPHYKKLCDNRSHGYYAYPFDATSELQNKYVHCTKLGSAYIYYCGSGTIFNEKSKLCELTDKSDINYNLFTLDTSKISESPISVIIL